jgi:hypothetical protein
MSYKHLLNQILDWQYWRQSPINLSKIFRGFSKSAVTAIFLILFSSLIDLFVIKFFINIDINIRNFNFVRFHWIDYHIFFLTHVKVRSQEWKNSLLITLPNITINCLQIHFRIGSWIHQWKRNTMKMRRTFKNWLPKTQTTQNTTTKRTDEILKLLLAFISNIFV